jgi:hypothetical protein
MENKMAESFEYKGHQVEISVDEGTKGLWTWNYTIDGGPLTENRDRRLASRDLMLAEATHSAKMVIDQMEYRNNSSPPIFTKYGAFEIAVRTSPHTWGELLGKVSASYEVFRGADRLSYGSLTIGYPTAEEAAANALSVAKQIMFEDYDWREPDVGV